MTTISINCVAKYQKFDEKRDLKFSVETDDISNIETIAREVYDQILKNKNLESGDYQFMSYQ